MATLDSTAAASSLKATAASVSLSSAPSQLGSQLVAGNEGCSWLGCFLNGSGSLSRWALPLRQNKYPLEGTGQQGMWTLSQATKFHPAGPRRVSPGGWGVDLPSPTPSHTLTGHPR